MIFGSFYLRKVNVGSVEVSVRGWIDSGRSAHSVLPSF